MENFDEDLRLATEVRKNAHAPLSKYTVGAVLKTKNGTRYVGCNVQNYGIQAICAERVAFCNALSAGEREFESILLIGGRENQNPVRCLPCGYCRQFMNEFVEKNFKIYTVFDGKIEEYTLEELLPYSFDEYE